jgi:hypothetical protein
VSLEIPLRTEPGSGKIGVGLPKHPGLLDERVETFLRAGMQQITEMHVQVGNRRVIDPRLGDEGIYRPVARVIGTGDEREAVEPI